jgi:hypothetical protein
MMVRYKAKFESRRRDSVQSNLPALAQLATILQKKLPGGGFRGRERQR